MYIISDTRSSERRLRVTGETAKETSDVERAQAGVEKDLRAEELC